MHKRSLPLWVRLFHMASGRRTRWWALPTSGSPHPWAWDNGKQWQTKPWKRDHLCCAAPLLHCTRLGFRLSSGSVLLLLWTTLLGSVPHGSATCSEPHPRAVCATFQNQFLGSHLGGVARCWVAAAEDEVCRAKPSNSALMKRGRQKWHFWGCSPYSSPWRHNPQQWFEGCRIAV